MTISNTSKVFLFLLSFWIISLPTIPQNMETQTIPPPRSTFGANVLQWVIYDSYCEDFAQQEKEREKEITATSSKKPAKREEKKREDKSKTTEQMNKKYLQSWQILERMVNQVRHLTSSFKSSLIDFHFPEHLRRYRCRLSILRRSLG